MFFWMHQQAVHEGRLNEIDWGEVGVYVLYFESGELYYIVVPLSRIRSLSLLAPHSDLPLSSTKNRLVITAPKYSHP
jgi:hypothetical protein